MAALQCEICGGKLMARSGGIFECDCCGVQYDKARVQEMVQEIKGTVKVEGTVQVAGTVKVEGPVKVDGPVQVDGVSTLQNHIKRGNMALAERHWKEAIIAFDLALDVDVECAEAYLGKYLAKHQIASRNAVSVKYGTQNYRKYIYSPLNAFEQDDVRKIRKFAKGELAQWFAECDEKVKAENAIQRKAEEERQIKLSTNAANLKPVRDKIQKLQGKILSAAVCHAVGLRSDGTVIAAGNNSHGQCNVQDWFDIVAVFATWHQTFGLKADGTVVATGDNEYGQCDVEWWEDIIAIAGDWRHTVGLKKDGTVRATGDNEHGQCNVYSWKNIVAIAAGADFTLGLQADGKVICAGKYYFGPNPEKKWYDIIDISANWHHAVGLRANGSTTCNNTWTDAIAVVPMESAGVALDVNGCVDISAHRSGIDGLWQWKDIVTVAAGSSYILAVRKDGTVVAKGNNEYGQCDVSGWKLFDDFDHYEQETAEKRRQAAQRRLAAERDSLNSEKAALSAELAGLKGLFTGKRRKELEAQLAQIDQKLNDLH